MERFIQKFSGFFFYTFGILFFGAYFCYYNEIYTAWALWIFEVFDLPFALVACIYGGTSLHLSITKNAEKGRISAIIITIFLTVVFGWLIALNYWEVLGLPTSKN